MGRVPSSVSETLEEIRQSGETNMADVDAVQALADERGAHETVVWLEKNRDRYWEFMSSWK